MLFRQFAAQRTQRFPLAAFFATHQLAGRAAGRLGALLRFQITAQLQADLALEQRPATVRKTQTTKAFQIDIRQATRHQLTEQ